MRVLKDGGRGDARLICSTHATNVARPGEPVTQVRLTKHQTRKCPSDLLPDTPAQRICPAPSSIEIHVVGLFGGHRGKRDSFCSSAVRTRFFFSPPFFFNAQGYHSRECQDGPHPHPCRQRCGKNKNTCRCALKKGGTTERSRSGRLQSATQQSADNPPQGPPRSTLSTTRKIVMPAGPPFSWFARTSLEAEPAAAFLGRPHHAAA